MTNQVSYCHIPDCMYYNLAVAKDHIHHVDGKPFREKVLEETTAVPSEGKNSYRKPIKYRFDLIPPIVLQQLAEIYEEGVQVYGENKYIKKPLPYSVILNHLMNHLLMFCSGDRSELHLAKVIWGAATLINLEALQDEGFLKVENDLTMFGAKVSEALQENKDSMVYVGYMDNSPDSRTENQ